MKKILCLVLALCLFCGTLISCDTGSGKSNKRYTVSFDTNGGSAINDMEVKAGAELRAPVAPTKEGYVFDGWYEDEDFFDKYVFGEMPAKDITLYAKWKLDTKRMECEGCGEMKNCVKVDMDGETGYLCSECKELWEALKDALGEENGGGEGDASVYDYCDECGFYAECEPYYYMGITLMLCPSCVEYYDSYEGNGDSDMTCYSCGMFKSCAYYVYDGITFLLCDECKLVYDDMYDHTGESGGGNVEVDTSPQQPDANATYTVTFKYVDANGHPMEDAEGETQKQHNKIKPGKDAKNVTLNDPQAFADYVIIGWNADLEQAKAGKVDDNATKKITADKTLYSVVREKNVYTVTFRKADTTVYQTLELKEGTVIDARIARPVQMGTYFKAWALYTEDSESSVACIRDDCEFIAAVGATDGTIGKVAPGTITVDGIKEDAYMTSGAYLPVNTTLQADRSTTRAEATVDADTYLVWDGDYIYMLMEVSDKSLVGRADAYMKGGVDAYLNDLVEVWYSFEQDTSLTKNETRVGVDAMGYSKYALPRSVYNGNTTGIGGGRSTHYDDIEVKVRNCVLGDWGSDLSKTGYVGNATYTAADKAAGVAEPEYMASYIIEFAFPAWTEGAADTTKGADPKTGLLPGKNPESNNINDYAFTTGDKLNDGDFVRFNLQINDLMLAQRDMTGAAGTYFWDSPPESALAAAADVLAGRNQRTMLYATDGMGNIIGMANTTGLFSASGSTQRDLQYYVMFSLSGTAEAETIVHSLAFDTVDGKVVPIMLDRFDREYVRS